MDVWSPFYPYLCLEPPQMFMPSHSSQDKSASLCLTQGFVHIPFFVFNLILICFNIGSTHDDVLWTNYSTVLLDNNIDGKNVNIYNSTFLCLTLYFIRVVQIFLIFKTWLIDYIPYVVTWLYYNWKFVLVNPLYLFHLPSHPPSPGTH